ncbi:MAG: sensor histidine kinase [Alphaproteobacteria bacterium]|nr:sensor histidine kinase [Alphaproteobacteria bacterium]
MNDPAPPPHLGRPESEPKSGGASLNTLLTVAFATLGVLGVVVAGGVLTWQLYQSERRAAIHDMAFYAATVAKEITTLISELEATLTAIGQYDAMRAPHMREARVGRVLSHTLGRYKGLESLAAVDASGHEVQKVSRIQLESEMAYLEHAGTPLWETVQSGKAYLDTAPRGLTAQAPNVTLATPVTGAGPRDDGAMVAVLNLKFLWSALAKLELGPGHSAYVIDRHGRMLSHTLMSQVLRGVTLDPVMTEDIFARPRRYSVHERTNAFGEPVLSVAVGVEPHGWAAVYEIPLAEAYRPVFQAVLFALIVVAVVAAVAALAGYVMARRLSLPLSRLTAAATRISLGDFGKPVAIEGARETRQLGQAFTAMSRELASMVDALTRAKEEAEAASAAKTKFLSSMSHELRTPLNAILGFAQLLRMHPTDRLTEEQAANVDIILGSGEHLLELINEVLDLARIEADRVALDMEAVDVGDVVKDCAVLTKAMGDKFGVTIRMDASVSAMPAIHADRLRFKQALLNLVSNAVKYNRPGGAVTIRANMAGGAVVRVSVRDTGPGIPPSAWDKLFEPFDRLGAEVREIEGSGIGLTITKKLVELMGGVIGFDSEVGVGSTFWIDMPMADL